MSDAGGAAGGGGDGGDDSDKDEDEEEKEEEDEGPNFGKDGRPQGLTPPFEVSEDQAPTGKVAEVNGVQVYQTGQTGGVTGILLVGDFWGWNSGRVRVVADYLAKNMNAFTVVPKLLDSPSLEGGTDEDGLPPDFDVKGREKEMRKWLMRYVWQTFQPKIEAASVALRNAGAKRIAGVGFSFGAWAVCKAAEMTGEFVGSVLFYPSVHLMEELMDGGYFRLAGRMRGPALFMPAKDDPGMYGPEGDMFTAILQNHPNDAESEPFDDMVHGWVLRGDAGKPAVKEGIERSVTRAAKYLRKYLWPPPVGANAATLRLACQDGDAEMVRMLLSAGIPAGGKDAIDIVGLSPLHYAAKSEGSVQALRMLVEFEADVNVIGGISGETPMHVAASLGGVKAVKVLLQLRGDPDKVDKGGQTSLHYAAKVGSAPLVKMLVEAGASMWAKDSPPEQTPLHLAAWFGKEKVVVYMLKARMDVDPEDLRSQTPQKRAKQNGYEAVSNIFEAERVRREEAAQDAEDAAKAGAQPQQPQQPQRPEQPAATPGAK